VVQFHTRERWHPSNATDSRVPPGRLPEREYLAGLLDDARLWRSRALAYRGAGGTALLAEAAELAADMRILGGRVHPHDARLPFAALHRLLDPVLDRLDRLPGLHAAALRGAFGLGGPPDDRFLIGIAARDLLAALAEERPVLVLVDGAQWLDQGSEQALVLAARRLEHERVAILLATLTEPPAGLDAREAGMSRGRPRWPIPDASAGAVPALSGDELEDRRAWRLADAAAGPDEEAVAALDALAHRARRRRAAGVSASALERAAALSAAPEDRARRLATAAEAALAAGRHDHARALLQAMPPDAAEAAVRARAEFARCRLERGESPDAALDRILATVRTAGAGLGDTAGPMLVFAASAAWHTADRERLAAVAAEAGSLPGPTGPMLEQVVRDLVGPFHDGPATSGSPFASAGDLFDWVGPNPWLGPPPGVIDLVGRETEARHLYERFAEACRAQGRIARLSHALAHLGWADLFTGRWASAAAVATEGMRLARDTGHPRAAGYLVLLARLAALRGEARLCCRLVDETRAATRSPGLLAETTWSLALLELGAGDPEWAIERLACLAPLDAWPGRHTVALRASADLVEAAMLCGRDELAASALAAYERWAGADPAPVVRQRIHCGHALLPEGDAGARFEAALAVDGLARPFETARVRLLYGEWLLARRGLTEARQQLRQAVRTFDRLGAAGWSRRARRRLRAAGATVRRREAHPLDLLTPRELPAARLAARGLTDHEIGVLLFLAPRTVAALVAGLLPRLGLAARSDLAGLDLDDAPDRDP